jgi:hypothetical protein
MPSCARAIWHCGLPARLDGGAHVGSRHVDRAAVVRINPHGLSRPQASSTTLPSSSSSCCETRCAPNCDRISWDFRRVLPRARAKSMVEESPSDQVLPL